MIRPTPVEFTPLNLTHQGWTLSWQDTYPPTSKWRYALLKPCSTAPTRQAKLVRSSESRTDQTPPLPKMYPTTAPRAKQP